MSNFNLSNITTGPSPTPPRILIYADGGVGKNTFAANAKAPIFIRTEDGCGNLNVATFPMCQTYHDVVASMRALMEEEHQYQTLVLDSLDWLEPLIWAHVIEKNPRTAKGVIVNEISDYGYGDGYKLAMLVWEELIEGLTMLRDKKKMAIVLIAHAHIKKHDDPEHGSYDTYRIKLNEKAAAKITEDMDIVLFAKFQTVVVADKSGFGQETKRAMGGVNRVVRTKATPTAYAKNRYNLPNEIVVPEGDSTWNAVWSQLAERVPFYNQTNQSNK